MAEALSRLWLRFLPEIEQRAALVEAAAAALAAGTLTSAIREDAHAAAHKLAGTLGTFGMPEGTDAARKAETMLVEEVSEADAPELTACAVAIRAALAGRK
jgi:HPt (histidine-containing phosphotransfer) domain-containing protein